MHKHGGMWFWRCGRLGGSFYLTKRPAPEREPLLSRQAKTDLALCTLAALAWMPVAYHYFS